MKMAVVFYWHLLGVILMFILEKIIFILMVWFDTHFVGVNENGFYGLSANTRYLFGCLFWKKLYLF